MNLNNNEYNKAQDALRQILSTQGENAMSQKIQNTSETDIINMINRMDKNEMISKLNSMGLGFISEKIRNMSKDDLIRMLRSNPQILNKISNYIK